MGNFNCEWLIKLELLFFFINNFAFLEKKYGFGQSSLHILTISLCNKFMKKMQKALYGYSEPEVA